MESNDSLENDACFTTYHKEFYFKVVTDFTKVPYNYHRMFC